MVLALNSKDTGEGSSQSPGVPPLAPANSTVSTSSPSSATLVPTETPTAAPTEEFPTTTVDPLENKLTASDGEAGDHFSNYVAIDEDTLVVGAPYDADMGTDSGSAYVFMRSGSTWSEQAKLTASDGAEGDRFGFAVAIDGDTIVVAADLENENGTNSGAAYVFTRSGTI